MCDKWFATNSSLLLAYKLLHHRGSITMVSVKQVSSHTTVLNNNSLLRNVVVAQIDHGLVPASLVPGLSWRGGEQEACLEPEEGLGSISACITRWGRSASHGDAGVQEAGQAGVGEGGELPQLQLRVRGLWWGGGFQRGGREFSLCCVWSLLWGRGQTGGAQEEGAALGVRGGEGGG